jgi:radical SAM protein with 4Fe4S-binding SPASM domain
MSAESVYEKINRVARDGYPTVASIEVTARCNARCGYCYMQDCSFKELSTEQLCEALDKFSKNGIFHLHITGGEPFLRPDILDILSFAIEHNFFYCSLFTNGILLTEKHLDFLIRNREFFIETRMSVFSHRASINDAFFGLPGAFDTIMKNALFLKNNGLKVALALSIFDFNINELRETRKFFEDRDLPILLATQKIINGSRTKEFVAASTTYSFFKQYFLTLSPEELEYHKKFMKKSLETPVPEETELCFGRFDYVFMDAQGDLAQCVSFRKMKIGNIFENKSVRDILQASPDYHMVCALKKTNIVKCSSCKFYNFCSVCLGVIHSKTSSLDIADDQACNYAQALYDLID